MAQARREVIGGARRSEATSQGHRRRTGVAVCGGPETGPPSTSSCLRLVGRVAGDVAEVVLLVGGGGGLVGGAAGRQPGRRQHGG